MLKFKNGKSFEQAAEQVLRDYLLRCYATVSKQYQPLQQMPPDQGVEYLLRLRDEGKLRISLYPEGDLVKCRIEVKAEND